MTSPIPDHEAIRKALAELRFSMRHSAGAWMVPGWDGHKVANLLEDAMADRDRLAAELAGWRKGAEVEDEAYSALLAEVEALQKIHREWLAANSPGGWIDDLRNKADALKGMHRFFRQYPAWIPAPAFMEQVCEAVEAMNAAMAEGKED